ncbi:MAG: hypothetical protein P8R54_27390 [Myxococcota bacterium]|nr:hypothetical protein [Myxococcota bacterium]
MRFHPVFIANTTFLINVADGDPGYGHLVGPPGPTLGALFSMAFTLGASPSRSQYERIKAGMCPPVSADAGGRAGMAGCGGAPRHRPRRASLRSSAVTQPCETAPTR